MAERAFFNFEILPPIIAFNGYPLRMIFDELFTMGVFPFEIIKDRNNPLFKDIINSSPKGTEISCVIIPFRYNDKEFLA